jgi:hypothetical protein
LEMPRPPWGHPASRIAARAGSRTAGSGSCSGGMRTVLSLRGNGTGTSPMSRRSSRTAESPRSKWGTALGSMLPRITADTCARTSCQRRRASSISATLVLTASAAACAEGETSSSSSRTCSTRHASTSACPRLAARSLPAILSAHGSAARGRPWPLLARASRPAPCRRWRTPRPAPRANGRLQRWTAVPALRSR